MTIYIGSARSDERSRLKGGKVGDQKQTGAPDYKGEVSLQPFYVHPLGWYIIRLKDPEQAKKMAAAMRAACNNKLLGYDQANRYGVIEKGIYTKTPTECDCSSLYRACFMEATGVDPGNFRTATQVEVLKKTGLVTVTRYVSQSKTPVYDGDGLVSCESGHTVVVVSGSPRPVKKESKIMSTKFKPEGTSRGVLFFGVGHGGSDPGAVGYLREEDSNLAQALAAKDYAVAQGFTVVMSRTKDENDPLTEEIREANASGAICAVDFHNNAGGGDGFEAYYSVKSDAKGGKAMAKAIEKEVKAIGQNSRGCKTKANSSGSDYFGFIRQTTMPAVICEGCFVDNKTDVKLFDTAAELKAYGVAVAKGVIKWLEDTGRVKKQAAKAEKPAAKPAAKADTCKIELPVLAKGAKGKAVGTMQTLIIADGISCGSAEADQSFGPATDNAVRKYQKKHGLKVDGECGLKTWTSLLK